MNNVRKSPEKRTLIPSLKNERGQARSEDRVLAEPLTSNGPEKITCKRHKAGHYEHQHNGVGEEKSPFFKFETATITSERVPGAKHWSRAPHLSTEIIWWRVHVSLVKYCCVLLFGISIIKKINKPNPTKGKQKKTRRNVANVSISFQISKLLF